MDRLELLRDGKALNGRQMLLLIGQLSLPVILAQSASIIMSYVDAAMVGHLGSREAAAIGLVASCTWLVGSLCFAVNAGFTVQIAHAIGAKREFRARNLVKVGLLFGLVFSLILMGFGTFLSDKIPALLGANAEIHQDAATYFMIIMLGLPGMLLNSMAAGMLQCSGNMKLPSTLQIISCFLNVAANFLLIFETREVSLAGFSITVPGAGLGVVGAGLGTILTTYFIASLMLFFLLFKSKSLHLRAKEKIYFSIKQLKKAYKISWPIGLEQLVMYSAQIMLMTFVAPLGTISIAAHSFAITIESLCYMPGYGIGSAATTLIGQSIGAKRRDLTRKLAFLTTGVGMLVMTCTGVLMYIFAPELIGFFTVDEDIRLLGTAILRIEAIAEPLYAASIVANGVFRGAGSTFAPSMMNLLSMWVVRIPLAAFLVSGHGLQGVWMAMCFELCFRGTIYLVRLASKKWIPTH